jgi:cytochrome c
MNFLRTAAGLAAALLISATGVNAQTARLSQDDVKALTLKAADMVAKSGLDNARDAFNRDGEFKHDEIYVNVIDFTGTWLAYPPRPAAVGMSVLNVKDPDGKALVQDIIKLARDQGEGWIEYRWMNPASSKIEPKITFLKRVPDQELITYIGIYK